MSRSLRFLAVTTFVLLTGLAMPGHAADESASSQVSAHQRKSKSGQGSLSQQLAKQAREAAGEDDTGQFKSSASIQFIARLTGWSLENAYRFCVVLNFAVITGAIIWLSRTKLPTLFRNRTAFIQKALEEARKASEDANRRLAGIEARLSRLDVEISEMRATAEKEAVAEEQRIKAAAEEDARKIVESAGHEIAAAAKAARRELTAYAADLAVALAAKQIRVDAATDQALVRNFAQQLSGNGEPRKGKQ
jgi:F-type H+-transporting ATPase subunit b